MKAVMPEVPPDIRAYRQRTGADRFGIDKNEYFEGPPTVVVEIRSPGDETTDKMPFYVKLGVPELWVVDRDTKTPELYVLEGSSYTIQSPDDDGWVHSAETGVRLRVESGGKLAVQLAGQPHTMRVLPED